MIAMIFAAGLGTRLRPITDTMPKALVPVDGKSLLEIQIDKLYQLGVRQMIVNVHHFSAMIKDFIAHYQREGLEIYISDETDHLLNTGGGLKQAGKILAEKNIHEPLLVHNVDILDNANLPDFYSQCTGNVDAVLMVSERITKRYLLFDNDGRLVGWTNIETGEVKTPFENLDITACRKLAFAGMHVVTDRVFQAMEQFPDEFSIIDFYVSQCKSLNIKCYIPTNLQMLDIGKLEALKNAKDFYDKFYK